MYGFENEFAAYIITKSPLLVHRKISKVCQHGNLFAERFEEFFVRDIVTQRYTREIGPLLLGTELGVTISAERYTHIVYTLIRRMPIIKEVL